MDNYVKAVKILSLFAISLVVFSIALIFYQIKEEPLEYYINSNYLVNLRRNLNNKKPNYLFYNLPFQPNQTNKSPRLLFFGDMMLDRHVGEKINQYGLDYLFEKLASSSGIILSDYDIVASNLEGAVTNNGSHYDPVIEHDFAFSPKLIESLAEKYNFKFFNLANNHFSDQGERGIIETGDNLDKLGINFAGCADGVVADCSTKIIKIDNYFVGMAGFSMVYSKLNMAEVEKVINRLASSADLLIVNIHWGIEYEHQFNQVQQEAAYQMIDAGADVIIGHHPHVVQGIEVYKSRPIFYSLGNFIFDQYFSVATQQGLTIEINLTNQQLAFLLYPIKSNLSQVELMSGDEKEKFLLELTEWSQVNNQTKEQIKQGKIIIDR
jgi:poly-gamma-glutamate synthesis protein (capsule biosynthesis protein)